MHRGGDCLYYNGVFSIKTLGDWNLRERILASLNATDGIESPAEAIQAAKLALEEVIASARPHPTDNPTMYAAWGKAAAALRLLHPANGR